MASSSASSDTESVDIPAKPHQPTTFRYPKRSFGKKKVVQCSFKASWFAKWPFLHYIESKDVVFCHTCLVGFKLKRMRTNSADPAFVSHKPLAFRSFSALRRVKSYLRTTMTQERLNYLMLLYVHKERTDSLDLKLLVNDFICSDHRSNIFAKF